jgi:predicted nucleotidyltransferase
MNKYGLHVMKKDANFLAEFKNKVLHAYSERVKNIILFGSRATGKARRDSDFDVFIMVDKRERDLVDGIFDIAYEIYIQSDLEVDISPVIMSEEYFQNRLSQERRIALEITEKGIAL